MTEHALIIRFDDYGSKFKANDQPDIIPLVKLADQLDGILTADG